MKTIIHVNQHVIKSNTKTGSNEPPLTVKDYKRNRRCQEAVLYYGGVEIGRIVHRPHKPLSCGARVWIETENPYVTIETVGEIIGNHCPAP